MFSYCCKDISETRETLSEAAGHKNSQILYLDNIMPFAIYFYLPSSINKQASLALVLGDWLGKPDIDIHHLA